MSAHEIVDSISFSVTAGGVLLAVIGLRQARLARTRDFESFYIRRYWDLFDRMSVSARQGRSNTKPTASDQAAMHAYLHLCEDEIDLRKRGWISARTWVLWSIGIAAQVKRPAYEHALASHPEEMTNLRRFIDLEFTDPAGWPESKLERSRWFWNRPT